MPKGKGKPVLATPSLDKPFAFNVSHEGHYTLLGVVQAAGGEIGVDIMEYPHNPAEVQEGISLQLTTGEQRFLATVTSEERRAEMVTTLWSLKEAYVKATGDGILFGMERIEVDLDVAGVVRRVSVDGKDVKESGWDLAYGTIGGHPKHGWAAYWTGDKWDGQVNKVSWADFASHFA